MAIAGSSAPSFKARLVDGQLKASEFINRGADVIETEPQRAIERLRAGEEYVYVWLHGLNLAIVRAAFEPPSPLEALGWTSDCE